MDFRKAWLATAGAVLGFGLSTPVIAQPAQPSSSPSSKLLYSLETDCSIEGVASRCKVEAYDGTDATVYRTSANGKTISFRLIDRQDLRGAQIWDADSRKWIGLDRLSLDLKDSRLCINGSSLCFVNPNYFASLREDYPTLRAELIKARFTATNGQLSAICYTQEACDAGF